MIDSLDCYEWFHVEPKGHSVIGHRCREMRDARLRDLFVNEKEVLC